MLGTGTIVAVASPPGRSPRAVVRVSGPQTAAMLTSLTGGNEFGRGVSRETLALAGVRLPALVFRFPAPRSYTGEDSAEILLAGAPGLVQRLLDRACAIEGVRPAGPGEFSLRAYLGGRLTLDQAEGVASLVAAQTANEAADARRLLSGAAGDEARAWADEIAQLLALVEAGVDFVEAEDVVPIAADELRERLRCVRAAIAARAAGPGAQPAPEGPLIVLAGDPNAGKTTLLNALLGRERGVVSEHAGSTRDVIEEPLPLRGSTARLADAPGISRTPPVPAEGPEQQAAEAARDAAERADVVVHCDPTGRFAPLGVDPACVLRVRTKADRPGTDAPGVLPVCALDGWNLQVLRERLADLALGARDLTPRRRRALAAALAALDDAATTLDASPDAAVESPELVAESLRGALAALGDLAGAIPADEIIGRVFSAFCVGK